MRLAWRGTGSRRRTSLLAFAVAMALVLAACGGDDDDEGSTGTSPGTTEGEEPAGEPQPGGDLVYGIEAETDGLNPTANNFAIAAVIMGRAVFDPLAQFDEDGVPQPFLAESLTPNEDCTVWTITLRPGITFHDGTLLTSEAIKVHFESILGEPLTSLVPKDIFAGATPVTVVDELNATVAMSAPNCNFPAWLTAQFGMIGSPTWITAAKENEQLNQEPVGTGPFEFASRSVNSRTKFVKNPDYWQEGLPYLDSIEFVVSTDGQVRAQSLKSGDFDIIHTTREDDIKSFRDDDAVQLYEDVTEEEAFLMFNHEVPPFDDVRARRAIIQATDMDAYVEFATADIGTPATSVFHPDNPWYSEVDNYPQYDPEAARSLAAEYCGEHADQCEGGKLKFKLSNTPSADAERDFDIFSGMWADVATIDDDYIEQAEYITTVALGKFQMTAWRQYGALDPDYDTVWFDSRKVGAISINWPRIVNPELDELIDAQRAASDFEERKAMWKQINEIFNDNADYLWLTHSIWTIVTGEHVQSVTEYTLPDGATGWPIAEGRHNLAQIWISQ